MTLHGRTKIGRVVQELTDDVIRKTLDKLLFFIVSLPHSIKHDRGFQSSSLDY